MKRRFSSALLLFALLVTGCASSQPATKNVDTYANPLDVLIADPFIYREGDTYYLYGTAADDGLYVWTSHDLVNWRRNGYALKRTQSSWARRNFWAPELFKYRGKYYLHFTAQNANHDRRIVL